MKPIAALILSLGLALPAAAQEVADILGPVPAEAVTLDDLKWVQRPLVVFADTPNDPAFQQQMRYLAEDTEELVKRDVVIITDTDPDTLSDVRRKLRPRGFSLVLIDKDGAVKQRKPLPWHVREIIRAIDKFPLRQQEIRDRQAGG